FEQSVSPYGLGASGNVSIAVPAAGATNPRAEAIKTLSHPRILGALFLLVASAATVHYLTKEIEIKK
ncbi:hypothetical protein HZB00_00730, partial [Candidatus Woesearchaeota archaeon]|nr:hypothetical protein [Candidatus Woesearchaeota archaeon]